MPYFINIGRFKALKGVMGARGWHIFRRAKIISVRFGPIEVHNRYPKRFIWAARPTAQKFKRSTLEAAKKEMRQRIAEKQGERRANGDKAYQRLPAGQKILDMAERREAGAICHNVVDGRSTTADVLHACDRR